MKAVGNSEYASACLKLIGRCKLGLLAPPEPCARPQVTRKIQVRHVYPLLRLFPHHLLRGYKKISTKICSLKKIPFWPIIGLYFNQNLIRLRYGPVKAVNYFLLTLFQHWVSKSADVYVMILSVILMCFLNKISLKIILNK